MGKKDVKLPEIGEGVTEGELVQWLVKEGDRVEVDQAVAEMMTDKATVEVPSPSAGLVAQLKCKEGDMVEVGQTLFTLNAEGELAPSSSSQNTSTSQDTSTSQNAGTSPSASSSPNLNTNASPSASKNSLSSHSMEITPPVTEDHVLATPATRRLARELGISLNEMVGSGLAGRITYEDVLKQANASSKQQIHSAHQNHQNHQSHQAHQAHPTHHSVHQTVHPIHEQASVTTAEATTTTTTTTAATRTAIQPHGRIGNGLSPLKNKDLVQMEERIPIKGLRRKIAENMQLSKRIIPHFTLMDEAKVNALVRLREGVKAIGKKEGFPITYLPFIMKALVATLRQFPMLNASMDDQAGEIIYKHYYNIGFAADTPRGLVVPVIQGVENKSILEISHEIFSLSQRARKGRLTVQDMQGGTITITNIGSIGGSYATPVIFYPQVAILGIYKIIEKPIVEKGKLKAIRSMNLTITADHRLIDGAVAAHFLRSFIDKLENPGVLMLHMN